MRRQFLAGFAGFCVACTVWLAVRSGVISVPDVQVSFATLKAESAEPQDSIDASPTLLETKQQGTRVMRLASFQPAAAADPPKLEKVKIGTSEDVALDTGPAKAAVILLVNQNSTQMSFDVPASHSLEITLQEFGSDVLQKKNVFTAGTKRTFSFSQPGQYSLNLQETPTPTPATPTTFSILVLNATKNSDTYSVSHPRFIKSLELTAGADGTGKALKESSPGIYVSDGPKAKLKVTEEFVNPSQWTVGPDVTTASPGPFDITHSGRYDVTLNGSLTAAFVDGVKQENVNTLSTQKIEIRLESPSINFDPSIATVQQKLDLVSPSAAPPTVVFETLSENLLGTTVLLNDKEITIAFKSPLAGREFGIQQIGTQPRNGTGKWETSTLKITDIVQGPQSFRIGDVWAAANGDTVTVNVTAPTRAIDRPQIINYSETKTSNSPTSITTSGAIEVTGKSLFLTGIAPDADNVEVLVLTETQDKPQTFRRVQDSFKASVNAQGLWNVEVTIAGPLEPNRLLVALATGKSTHRYSKAVTLTTKTNDVAIVQLGTPKVTYKSPLGTKDEHDPVNSKFIGATTANITVSKISNLRTGDKLVAITQKGSFSSEAFTIGDSLSTVVTGLASGKNDIRLSLLRGSQQSAEISMELWVVNSGPKVIGVEPVNFGTAPGQSVLRIRFSSDNPLDEASARQLKNYVLVHNSGQGPGITPTEAVFDPTRNEVALKFTAPASPVTPDIYELRINAHNKSVATSFTQPNEEELKAGSIGIRDVYDNLLDGASNSGRGTDYAHVLSGGNSGTPSLAGLPLPPRMALSEVTAEQPDLLTQRVGLPDTTGPAVEYMEFTEPRKEQNGFNPSDKVVSRVARTYYFRDAHRMVQIINRRVKSYNAQNATMSRQLADKARIFAEQTIDRRREAERGAIEASSYAQQGQKMISRLQLDLQTAETNSAKGATAIQELKSKLPTLEAEAADANLVTPGKYPNDSRTPAQRLSDTKTQIAGLDEAVQKSQQDAALFRERTSASVAALDALRERELEERETMNREQAKEDRAIDHQFRLEVQAAHTDPDTYAPGIPDSDDPVAQVSMSVIGEGLIQMRGPLKGVNIIHTMINEIDSPVGQVRVGIHTVQINGEKGKDMEEIAARIQRYTDHSRFLTSQSAQMLRNAVAQVASRKAEECGVVCDQGVICEDGTIIPPGFGDSVNGMQAVGMNGMPGNAATQRYQDAFFGSEFMSELRAMDSEFVRNGNKLISLNSMDSTSLASALFLMSLASNQTRMEILETFQQMTMYKLPADEFEYFDASDTKKRYHFHKFKFMADNARFVSLRGYFNAEIVGDNTLNPAQREFIKLAQILKSRLITEIELKQRVIERSLIEERVGNYEQQLRDAVAHEKMALEELKSHQKSLRENLATVLMVANGINSQAVAEQDSIWETVNAEVEKLRPVITLTVPDILRERALLNTPLESTRNLPAEQQLPDVRSQAFSKNLGLPTAWYFQAAKGTLDRMEVVDSKSGTALNTALKNDDYEAFMVAVLDYHQQFIAIALNDPNLPDELRDVFADPEAKDFANFAIKYRNEQSLTLKIIRNYTPEGNPRYEVSKPVYPNEFPPFKLWLWGRVQEIANHRLAINLPEEFQRELNKQLKTAVDPTAPNPLIHMLSLFGALKAIEKGNQKISDDRYQGKRQTTSQIVSLLREAARASIAGETKTATHSVEDAHKEWVLGRSKYWLISEGGSEYGLSSSDLDKQIKTMDDAMAKLLLNDIQYQFAAANAESSRRPLDHKKFLDMLIDEAEEKHIQLLEGTRAHTAVIDDYVKRICTALEDDFNTQFYEPAFRQIREETYRCGTVSLGQIEHTSILTNNREFAKVQPQATMEFDLPKRRIMVAEAMAAAQAGMNDYGALLSDPNFLALTKLYSGQPTAPTYTGGGDNPAVRDVLPGLPSESGESAVIQARTGQPEFASQLEALIPDPAIYKFETGTGYEIRPVIQPDGQSVVFDFNYMYTTNVHEPVDANEKHLGRVKRHFIDTDVQIGNYELREVSRYRVALKAERSGRGVPLLEDIPVAGALFRPMNNGESSLQQNVILAQSVIYPTLFDLMGLRWAPAVADLNIEDVKLQEFTYRNRMRYLKNDVYDYSSAQVDEFLRIPQGERRADLYRTQVPIPAVHPNGYMGPGNGQRDSTLQEGYVPQGMPGDSMIHDSNGMPGESGNMLPPVEMAPLLPYGHQTSNGLRRTPAAQVTQTSYQQQEQSRRTGTGRGSEHSSSAGVARLSDSINSNTSSRSSTGPSLGQNSVGRATLSTNSTKSQTMTQPVTNSSGWKLRLPGRSNTGK